MHLTKYEFTNFTCDNFNRRSRLDLAIDLCVYINGISIAIVPINTNKASLMFDISIVIIVYTCASSVYGKLRTYHSLYLNVQPAGKTLLSLINYIYEGVSCKHVTK